MKKKRQTTTRALKSVERRKALKVLNNEHPCGPCTACCTAMAVQSIHKPAGVKCQAQNDQGCARYETRPKQCVVYACGWKMGLQAERPDIAGFLLSVQKNAIGVQWLQAIELREGALAANRDALEKTAYASNIQIAFFAGGTPNHAPVDAVGPGSALTLQMMEEEPEKLEAWAQGARPWG